MESNNKIDPRVAELQELGVRESDVFSMLEDMSDDMSAEEYLCRRFLFTGADYEDWMTEEKLSTYRRKAAKEASQKGLARKLRDGGK